MELKPPSLHFLQRLSQLHGRQFQFWNYFSQTHNITHWEIMYDTPKFSPVADALKCGLEKLWKWYKTIDESSSVLVSFSSIIFFSSFFFFSLASFNQA